MQLDALFANLCRIGDSYHRPQFPPSGVCWEPLEALDAFAASGIGGMRWKKILQDRAKVHLAENDPETFERLVRESYKRRAWMPDGPIQCIVLRRTILIGTIALRKGLRKW